MLLFFYFLKYNIAFESFRSSQLLTAAHIYGIEKRNEWWCSQDKNSTLSIQACLNIETLFDRVAATGGMQYSWLLSLGADKPGLYLEPQCVI